MIREAREWDIEPLAQLGERYAEKSGHPSSFDRASAFSTFSDLIRREDTLLLVNDDVSAAAATWLFPLYLNMNDLIAECAFIWSDTPGDGRKMLQMCEEWGRNRGARYFHVYALKNRQRVISLYERAGYSPLETTYMKEL